MWLSCICVHLLVTVCADTAAIQLNYYLQSPFPSSFRRSLPSGIFSFPEFIPFPLFIPMVPDYSRTIMSLVTIVLHVKRVLTNDKDGIGMWDGFQITVLELAQRPCAQWWQVVYRNIHTYVYSWNFRWFNVNNGLWEHMNIEKVKLLFVFYMYYILKLRYFSNSVESLWNTSLNADISLLDHAMRCFWKFRMYFFSRHNGYWAEGWKKGGEVNQILCNQSFVTDFQ